MKSASGNNEISVLIIGGGPTGLSLALGLAKCGIHSVLVEKNLKTSETSKAPVIHVRTREIFRQWDLEETFLRAGNLVQNLCIRSPREKMLFSLNFEELQKEAFQPGLLIIEQGKTEKILLNAVRKTNLCDVRFATEAVEIQQNQNRVSVKLKDKDSFYNFKSEYVIGCDGASSFVRHALNLPFNGHTYPVRTVLADVKIRDNRDRKSWPRFCNQPGGVTVGIKLYPGLWRIIHLETGGVEDEEKVPETEIREWVNDVLGEGEVKVTWSSPFKIHRRSSPKFRLGRVFLAGDAAHIHSPIGGQGMNAGIQDAHNLAWKLARVILHKEIDSEKLLNSYEKERREIVVKRVSRYTNFMTRLFLQSPKTFRALAFFILRRVLSIAILRQKFLRRTAMIKLDIKKSPVLNYKKKAAGLRLPNPILQSPEGKKIRLYELLPNKAVLLSVNNKEEVFQDLEIKTIKIGAEAYKDTSGLITELLPKRNGWILVRPDAHIVWARSDKTKIQDAVNLAARIWI